MSRPCSTPQATTGAPDRRRNRRAAAALAAAVVLLAAAQALAGSMASEAASAARIEAFSPPQVGVAARRQDPGAPPTPLPEHYGLVDVWQVTQQDRYLYHPEGVDVGRDGLIAIAERGNHRVSIWRASGESVAKWGREGAAPGDFSAPEDVAVDVDRARLYVADTGNRRVQVLDRASGNPVAVWDDVGLPRGVAVGSDDRVFVADGEGHRILVFDPGGEQLAVWGGPGSEPGQFDTPLGMSVGPDGYLYVADSGNQRVQWLDGNGFPAGALNLENTGGPGGSPRDVGTDETGDLYVAVDRGVLRYRGRSTYAGTILPQREIDDPDCPIPQPGRCRILIPIVESHEGVRRLAVTPGGGVYLTYAPALRYGDGALVSPARGFPTFIGNPDMGSHWRRVYDPARIDAGADPYHAQTLDTSGLLRIYRSNGQWYDGMHAFKAGPGVDIASDRAAPRLTAVLTGNQVEVQSLLCFLGCDPAEIPVLDPDRMTRFNRVGERVPDQGWWLTSVAVRGSIAVLNTGYQQLIVRAGFGCGGPPTPHPCDPPSDCKRGPQVCPSNPVERDLIAVVSLNRPSDPFRAFSDLAYDAFGGLSILARDGGVVRIDARGRRQDELALQGLAPRTAEAIAVSNLRETFVLTGDGWIFKFDTNGQPLAAWEVAAEAGPGRYRDLTLDNMDRILVPDGANDRTLVFAPAPGPAPEPPPPPDGGPCTVTPDKRADPARLVLGETTEVTLELEGTCGGGQDELDVVLVMDASCQMAGARLARVREAGVAFVDAMTQPRDRLAVVSFSDKLGGAKLLAPLTDDTTLVRDTARGYDLDCLPPMFDPDRHGDGRISDGLRAGREALFGPQGRDDAGKVIVLLSPSIFDRELLQRQLQGFWIEGRIAPAVTEREHAMWEAWRLWEMGVRIYTVGVGGGSPVIGPPPAPTPDLQSTHPPDQGLLASLAYPAGNYRYTLDPAGLLEIYRDLGRELSERVLFRSLEIVDRLPANMRLVPGSINIPAEPLPDGALRWRFADVDFDGPPILSYRVEPLEVGLWPTNIEAVATYEDGRGFDGRVLFPIPQVEVLAPTPTSTPEPTSTNLPSPTPTFTPSATPTSTPTASPTPTPTRAPEPLYLPMLYFQTCRPKVQPLDVALLIDTSSSMAGAKLNAAVHAARTFVGLLNLPRDHAAVITFNRTARRAQPLTGDRAALERALSGLTTDIGTRIDLGLWEALDAIAGPDGRPEADPVLILLTDGRPLGGTEGSTRLAAQVAQGLGVTIYAIGLGDDVDPFLLREIAGDASRMYLAPDESELARIYAEVARVIPCR